MGWRVSLLGINVKLGFFVDFKCLEVVWALTGWRDLSYPVVVVAFQGELPFQCVACGWEMSVIYYFFSVSCTISVTWQRKETRRSVLLHTEGVLCDGLSKKCLICKIPSFPCQSSPLAVVLSAVVTSISRLSETGAHFQRRIWKIVQIFFPLCDLSAGPSWVSCSDFIQRFSYNRCTE